MKGKIISIRLAGGGVIKPAGKGEVPDSERDHAREREFGPAAWLPGWAAPPRVGELVEYDADPANWKRAINVRPAGASAEQAADRRRLAERRRSQERTYRRVRPQGELFLNPYNFVRPLPDLVPTPGEPESLLLGRCPPPPHDRNLGLSGRLVCSAETRSPTFVSDSHQVKPDPGNKDHRTYRFHRESDGSGAEVPCIPASTLRGVVRSVFEAVTNSCWEHVAADRRLSRRVAVRSRDRLTPGRIERAQDGSWSLRVMRDAFVPRYNVKHPVPIPAGVQHGSACRAALSDGWVRRLYAADDPAIPADAAAGWYFETGNNATGKHNERFFHDAGKVLPLSEKVVEAYVLLIADYRERHQRQRENDAERRGGARGGNRPPEDSRFLRPDAKVPLKVEDCEGELVYARMTNDASPAVQAVSPVSIPRIMFDRSLFDVFPDIDAVKPCSRVNANGELRLCPACRTFGWVATDAKRTASSRAVRSRVRFGSARFAADALDHTPCTLEILSAPKPTTIRFYLLPKDGVLTKRTDESAIDYDSGNAELRGRKFYRRRSEAALDGADRSGQNRTLRDHLKARRSATFEIIFQNLAPLELGALLWSVELEPDWAHRLGHGKPLGLGAVRMAVTDARVFGTERYEGAAASIPLTDAARSMLVERFRAAMEAVHGSPFSDLPNVADLRAILSPPDGVHPVMYPRLPAGEKQESFEWFVENRSPRGGHWLDLADGDAALPRDPASGTEPR